MSSDKDSENAVHIYGIPNCDRVRSARLWLEARGIPFIFHDFRQEGVHAGYLACWCRELGWETLLNRRSTTWKQLPETDHAVPDAAHAMALMLKFPTLIKRPVLAVNGRLLVGFDDAAYADCFGR